MKENKNVINELKSFFEKPEAEMNENTLKKLKRILSSVVIAVVVWFVVINVVDPNISVWKNDVPVTIKGENTLREKKLVIVNKEDIPKIAVKINGTRSELIDGMDRIRAEIDVSNISSLGTATVSPGISMPDYIGLEKQNFSYTELVIEPAYNKEIPVIVNKTGEGRLEGKMVSCISSIEKVEISGAKEDIDKAAYCVVNVDVNPELEAGTVMYTYEIAGPDKVILDDADTLYCSYNTIPVENRIYDRHTLEIKTSVPDELKEEYVMKIDRKSLSENKVDVGVPEGKDAPSVIIASLEPGQYTSGKTELKLQIPEGCYAEKKVVTADLKIEKRVEKFMNVSVKIENVPGGLKVNSPVVISAKMSVPESLDGSVEAFADASGCTEGEHRIAFEFEDEDIYAIDIKDVAVMFEKK